MRSLRSLSRRLLHSLLVPCLLATGAARAADPDTIPSASSLTVVTRGDIETHQWRTLADVLRNQPGVHVSQLGGVGQATQVFFRGQRAGRVLLRIDGIDVSDPGARDPGLVIPDLQTLEIERIELRRGPQSASAGSDAVGGVIDVVTRRGEGAVTPWAAFEAGSFQTTQQSLGISGGTARVAYTLGYSNLHSAGTSATRGDVAGSAERDAYENDSLAGRLDVVATRRLSFTLTGRFIRSDLQADSPSLELPFAGVDFSEAELPDDRRELERGARQLFLGATGDLELWRGRWSQQWSVQYARHDRDEDGAFRRGPTIDPALGKNVADTENRSRRLSLGWANRLELTPEHVLRFGAEIRNESFERSTQAAEVFNRALIEASRSLEPGPPLEAGDPDRSSAEAFADQIGLLNVPRAKGEIPTFPVSFLGNLTGVPTLLGPDGIEQLSSTHRRRQDFALFAEDRFTFLEHFFAEGGVRVNDQGVYGSRLSYRAGLGYLEPLSGVKFFANVATGFRDPELRFAAAVVSVQTNASDPLVPSSIPGAAVRRLGDSLRIVPFVVRGDESFEPEVTRGLEVGAEIPLGLNGSARIGYFTTRSRGVLGVRGGVIFGNRLKLSQDDILKTRSRGIEVAADLVFPFGARVALGYTYTHSELRHGEPALFPPEPVDPTIGMLVADLSETRRAGGDDESGVPKHQAKLSLQLTRWEPLTVVLGARYVSALGSESRSTFGPFDPPSLARFSEPGFATADFALAYRIGERFTVFSRVENVFDSRRGEGLGSQRPGRAAYVGVATRY